jgi:hypothetical protein
VVQPILSVWVDSPDFYDTDGFHWVEVACCNECDCPVKTTRDWNDLAMCCPDTVVHCPNCGLELDAADVWLRSDQVEF